MKRKDLDRLLLSWPGTASDVKWQDDLVYTVAEKMFAVHCLRGKHIGGLSFKVETVRFLELTDHPGIEPAPYLARAHWIWLPEPGVLDGKELRALLRRSYELVVGKLSRKRQRELGLLTD
jgi:predicted DNA-binding protein (MmcQ/YjbR family)